MLLPPCVFPGASKISTTWMPETPGDAPPAFAMGIQLRVSVRTTTASTTSLPPSSKVKPEQDISTAPGGVCLFDMLEELPGS